MGKSIKEEAPAQKLVVCWEVRLQFVEARVPEDFDRAFSHMTMARAGALTVLVSPMFFGERRGLVDLAAKNQLPAVYPWREFVDAGGLMA